MNLVRFVTKFAKENSAYPICFSFANLAGGYLMSGAWLDCYDF
jgi:hypothetical protein